MATIVVGHDAISDTTPPPDGDGPPTRWQRLDARLTALLAFLSGCNPGTTKKGAWWKHAARLMIFVAAFPQFAAYHLFPCKGEKPCDQDLLKTLMGPAATLVMGWASLTINIRATNERRQQLIKGVGRGKFARVITLVGSIMSVFMVMGMRRK